MVTGAPFEVEAAQVIVTVPFVREAWICVGALGGPEGVVAFDGDEGGPSPIALVAVTVKVYVSPSVRPETSVDVCELLTDVTVVGGDVVMVYRSIGLP